MKQLSGLDATFLYLETPETPMHVGGLHLYELPKSFKGSFQQAVIAHLSKRVHLAPILTRVLAFMPFDLGHPAWVESQHFDLRFHIRQVPAKKSNAAFSVKEVQAIAAKLHSQLIDRNHPLWEFHVFENIKPPPGLQIEGRLVGFQSKIHHAALDGKGGAVLANAILDLTPVPREVPPPDPSKKRKTASDLKIGEMIGAVFSNSLAQYAKLAKALPQAATQIGSMGAHVAGSTAKRVAGQSVKGIQLQLAPKTLFNTGITTGRVFATATLPFAQCRAMGKALGASFNDVVLWICSTALRNFLKAHASLPRQPLIAAMPVSLREADNKEFNNQASMSLVDLATHMAHPLKRMQAIMASTAKVKASISKLKGVLPTDYPSLLAPWLVGRAARAAMQGYGGVASRLPALANVVISNVPGPQVPLYLAGAKMLTFHPLSIIIHGIALNITIQTYAGHVDFGLIADKKAVPDVQDLADALQAAFDEAMSLYAQSPSHSKSQAANNPPATDTPLAKPRSSGKTTKVRVSQVTKKTASRSRKALP
jgi:diacylglycerol O-acyltransferase / wax synthase